MRIAIVVAVFVILCAAGLVGVVAPASGQTVPPPTETATATPDFPYPTPRPTVDGTPDPTSTPDPDCPANDCFPAPTPHPIGPTATPNPACPQNDCFPFPTPRPTFEPGATVQPAQPDPGTGIWYYSFMPIVGRR